MEHPCDAVGCYNRRPTYSLFRIPRNPIRLAKWKANIKIRESDRVQKHICSVHFEDSAFTEPLLKKHIFSSAVPTKQYANDNRPKPYSSLGIRQLYGESSNSEMDKPTKSDGSSADSDVIDDPETSLLGTSDSKFSSKRKIFLMHREIEAVKSSTDNKRKYCAAKGCMNSYPFSATVLFFPFPNKDPVRIAQWEHNVEMKNAPRMKNRYLCSDHFEDWCFTSKSKDILTRDAVPTLQSAESLPSEENSTKHMVHQWIDDELLKDSVVVAEVSLCADGKTDLSLDIESDCIWERKKIDQTEKISAVNNQRHSTERLDSDDELLVTDDSFNIRNGSTKVTSSEQKPSDSMYRPVIHMLKPSFNVHDQTKSSVPDPFQLHQGNSIEWKSFELNPSENMPESQVHQPKRMVNQMKIPSKTVESLSKSSGKACKTQVHRSRVSANPQAKITEFITRSNCPVNVDSLSNGQPRITVPLKPLGNAPTSRPSDTAKSPIIRQQILPQQGVVGNPFVLDLPFNLKEINKPIKLSICVDKYARARLIGSYRLGPDKPESIESSNVSQTEAPETELQPVVLKVGGPKEPSASDISSERDPAASCRASSPTEPATSLSEEDTGVEHEDAGVEHEDAEVEHEDAGVEHEDAEVEHEDDGVEYEDAGVEHEGAEVVAKSLRKRVSGRRNRKRLHKVTDFIEEDMCSEDDARAFYSTAMAVIADQKEEINLLKLSLKCLNQKVRRIEERLTKARDKEKAAKEAAKEAQKALKRIPKQIALINCKPEYHYVPNNRNLAANMPETNDCSGSENEEMVQQTNASSALVQDMETAKEATKEARKATKRIRKKIPLINCKPEYHYVRNNRNLTANIPVTNGCSRSENEEMVQRTNASSADVEDMETEAATLMLLSQTDVSTGQKTNLL